MSIISFIFGKRAEVDGKGDFELDDSCVGKFSDENEYLEVVLGDSQVSSEYSHGDSHCDSHCESHGDSRDDLHGTLIDDPNDDSDDLHGTLIGGPNDDSDDLHGTLIDDPNDDSDDLHGTLIDDSNDDSDVFPTGILEMNDIIGFRLTISHSVGVDVVWLLNMLPIIPHKIVRPPLATTMLIQLNTESQKELDSSVGLLPTALHIL